MIARKYVGNVMDFGALPIAAMAAESTNGRNPPSSSSVRVGLWVEPRPLQNLLKKVAIAYLQQLIHKSLKSPAILVRGPALLLGEG